MLQISAFRQKFTLEWIIRSLRQFETQGYSEYAIIFEFLLSSFAGWTQGSSFWRFQIFRHGLKTFDCSGFITCCLLSCIQGLYLYLYIASFPPTRVILLMQPIPSLKRYVGELLLTSKKLDPVIQMYKIISLWTP